MLYVYLCADWGVTVKYGGCNSVGIGDRAHTVVIGPLVGVTVANRVVVGPTVGVMWAYTVVVGLTVGVMGPTVGWQW